MERTCLGAWRNTSAGPGEAAARRHSPRSRSVPCSGRFLGPIGVLIAAGLVVMALLGAHAAAAAAESEAAAGAEQVPAFAPSRAELDEVRQWLCRNPPDGQNRAERRQRMTVIQAACDKLEPETYWDYADCCVEDPDAATAMEQRHPALYYLRRAVDDAVEDIRRTEVEEGLAVWFIYNMGHVFKTPDACFGIDINMPAAERLAEDLDFLLITHEHGDHYSPQLLDAMINAGKPVVTRWYPSTTIVNEPREFRFGEVRVKVDIGDHHHERPDTRNDMLMFQVDCGRAGNNCTVYHSGDGNNYEKMVPDRRPDLFIVHVQVGMSVEEAVNHLKPRMTLVAHVMELGHSPKPPNAWRWPYEYAFRVIQNTPPGEATVLTWGERWLLPDTTLRSFRHPPRDSTDP